MTRKHFTEDFRKEAVRLALNSDLSRHQVADDLGVGHSTLGKWQSHYASQNLGSFITQIEVASIVQHNTKCY